MEPPKDMLIDGGQDKNGKMQNTILYWKEVEQNWHFQSQVKMMIWFRATETVRVRQSHSKPAHDKSFIFESILLPTFPDMWHRDLYTYVFD